MNKVFEQVKQKLMSQYGKTVLKEMSLTTTGEVILRWNARDCNAKSTCTEEFISLCEANGHVAIPEEEKSGDVASYFRFEPARDVAQVAPNVSPGRLVGMIGMVSLICFCALYGRATTWYWEEPNTGINWSIDADNNYSGYQIVHSYGKGASMDETVYLPSKINGSVDFLFSGKSYITNGIVTVMGSNCFQSDASNVKVIVIPESVVALRNNAVQYLNAVEKIIIKGCVKKHISDQGTSNPAFKDCSKLKTVICEGKAALMWSGDFVSGCNSSCTLYVRRDSTGWTTAIPGTWKGVKIDYIDFYMKSIRSSWPYDGKGHGVEVDCVSKYDDAVVEYATAENGPYSAMPILFTNVSENTTWYRVYSASAGAAITNSAAVSICATPANGIAGLTKVTYAGKDFTSTPYLGIGSEIVTNCDILYSTALAANTTYSYSGYMFFESGVNYTLRSQFNGFSQVKISNEVVLDVSNATTARRASISFPKGGWKLVDFRVYSETGGSGLVTGADYQGAWFKRENDDDWSKIEDPGDGSLLRTSADYCGVEIVSAGMRPSDPSIMDIVYKVHSSKEKVDIRAIAYENGNRSLANTIIVESLVDGTETRVGTGITANEPHTISWRVADDWKTDLSKVRVEILAKDDTLLPLHLITIPKTKSHAAIQFSDTDVSETHVFNALLWLYASRLSGLTLTDGVLKSGDTQLASGTSVVSSAETMTWLYGQMGYSILTGDDLSYVNSMARINLMPSGLKQYVVVHPEE